MYSEPLDVVSKVPSVASRRELELVRDMGGDVPQADGSVTAAHRSEPTGFLRSVQLAGECGGYDDGAATSSISRDTSTRSEAVKCTDEHSWPAAEYGDADGSMVPEFDAAAACELEVRDVTGSWLDNSEAGYAAELEAMKAFSAAALASLAAHDAKLVAYHAEIHDE